MRRNIALVHPPGGYAFMPYLAPYLLKGYLRDAAPRWAVRVHDLNIEHLRHLWTEAYAEPDAAELAALPRVLRLEGELVGRFGAAAYEALRTESTFVDPAAVRRHHRVLQLAMQLDAGRRHLAGAHNVPRGLGAWGGLIDRWETTPMGRYVRARVDAGLFDDAGVVGVSVPYVEQIAPALLLARCVKQRRPETVVVFGGGAVTHLLREICNDASFWPDVDHVIPFEGEYSLARLLESLDGVGGLRVYRPLDNIVSMRAGEIHYTKDLGGRPRVDAVPDFSELEHAYPTPRPIYPLLTSKGCYWGKCAYCTHHEGYGQGFSRMSDALVHGALDALIEAGARSFYLVDEALPPRELARLAELFGGHRRRGRNVEWLAEARLERNLVRPEAVQHLVDSGCRLLVNGIESGDQVVVDRMRKGIDLELVAEHARLCRDAGIGVGWMFFIGFPGETDEQARATFRFIERHQDTISFAVVGCFALERGAPIWERPDAHGVREILHQDDWYRFNFPSVLADGSPNDTARLDARLEALHDEFDHLRPLFDGAIDRALLFFLQDHHVRTTDAELTAAGSLVYEWWSPHERARARYRPGQAIDLVRGEGAAPV
jgi:hypothetical protein